MKVLMAAGSGEPADRRRFCPQAKHPLREAHVELLGLRPGDYVVRVRCRSHNSRLWSKWSAALLVSVPNRPPAGRTRGFHGDTLRLRKWFLNLK